MTGLEIRVTMAAFMAFIALGVAWMVRLLPGGSASGVFFGVTVPEDFPASEPGLRARRVYQRWLALHGLIGAELAVLSLLVHAPAGWLAMLIGGVLWTALGSIAAYQAGRRRVLPYARPVEAPQVREAVLVQREPLWVGGWLGQAGPYLILLLGAAVLALNWGQIPDRFPSHFGLDGQPDAWMNRTPAGVFGPLLIGAVTCLLLAGLMRFLQWGLRRGTGVAGERQETILRMCAWCLLAGEYFVALIFALLGQTPVVAGRGGNPGSMIWIPFAAEAAMLLVIGWILVHYLQQVKPSPAVGDGTPDTCWKWGLIYVNRADPALFVEKRFGLGYTVNFGNPAAWWIPVGILGFLGLIIGLALAMQALSGG